jgi:hypothetical protein
MTAIAFRGDYLKTELTGTTTPRQGIPDYANAHHIFLLGPPTVSNVRNIMSIIKSPSRMNSVIIHVQGEANSTNPKLKTTERSAPMFTSKPGMFPVSFNFFSGVIAMFEIRTLVDLSFTLGVKPLAMGSPERVALHEQLVGRGIVQNKDLQNYIPPIYDDVLGFIEKNILLRPQGSTPGAIAAIENAQFLRLDTKLIYI